MIRLFTLLILTAGAAYGESPSPTPAPLSFPGSRTVFSDPVPSPLPSPDLTAREAILHIDHAVVCDPGAFHGLTGQVLFGGRTIRFELFEATDHTDFSLGTVKGPLSYVHVSVDPSPNCDLTKFKIENRSRILGNSLRDAILAHTPFLVARDDQYRNRLTDLPLALGYSVRTLSTKDGEHLLIKYTIFFSDEDSLPTVNDTEAQMAAYGRRVDVEWIYQVEIDLKTWKVVSRRYQGGAVWDYGHATFEFAGALLPDGQHPILYNKATHNVFSDLPSEGRRWSPPIGYALVPELGRHEIEYPLAREELGLREPWLYVVSDQELAREKKLAHPFGEYLYALIDGDLAAGAVVGVVRLRPGESRAVTSFQTVRSGGGAGNLDRLGEDLWGRRALTAVPLPPGVVGEIGGKVHGEFHLEKSSSGDVRLKVRELRFFRFVTYAGSLTPVAEELTSRFTCRAKDLDTVCRF